MMTTTKIEVVTRHCYNHQQPPKETPAMNDDNSFVEDLSPGAFTDGSMSKFRVAGSWKPLEPGTDIVHLIEQMQKPPHEETAAMSVDCHHKYVQVSNLLADSQHRFVCVKCADKLASHLISHSEPLGYELRELELPHDA
jgi:hypothetical protein